MAPCPDACWDAGSRSAHFSVADARWRQRLTTLMPRRRSSESRSRAHSVLDTCCLCLRMRMNARRRRATRQTRRSPFPSRCRRQRKPWYKQTNLSLSWADNERTHWFLSIVCRRRCPLCSVTLCRACRVDARLAYCGYPGTPSVPGLGILLGIPMERALPTENSVLDLQPVSRRAALNSRPWPRQNSQYLR
jgi:hypothetical protein